MNIFAIIYYAVLFFVLSPGVFLRLPQNGSKMMVTLVHAVIFGSILYFTRNIVRKMSIGLEGMEEGYVTDKNNCKGQGKKWDTTAGICRDKDGHPI